MNLRRSLDEVGGLFATDPEPVAPRVVLSEVAFHRMTSLERKRTERSGKPFLLMLLDMGDDAAASNADSSLNKIVDVLSLTTRETDVVGWYKNQVVVGVMFTQIELEEKKHVLNTMLSRVSRALEDNLSLDQFNQLSISFHWFPEEWGTEFPKRPSNPVLYPDLAKRGNGKSISGKLKRIMDAVGSLLALAFLSPLFLVIAVAIKLTSKGPVIFRQERLGQFGQTFTCLKFRSMRVNNDVTAHKQFMAHVIHGDSAGKDARGGAPVYKMTNDPRITPLGHILRRSSLDELPQFVNVLRGEMSLVGPRPPLAYEFQQYQIWHRRRVLEVKPGITGLWQVNGRSRVRFDDMVRLDLRYVRTWSPWLDIRILLQTPRAVLLGNDAF